MAVAIPQRLAAPEPRRPQPPRAGSAAARRPVRPEIQALRALAVTLVVAFHLSPRALPGGFIGVDVFFAISGFLITGLLRDEIQATGRLAPAAFWARRARRLLPAALLTATVCLLATVVFVPVVQWPQFLGDLRASALYAENWHLGSQAVDYFAPDGPSPVQHFWTLSAEEQFYVAWPLLLLVALTLARLARRTPGRGTPLGVAAAVTAGGLAWSVHATAVSPAGAYFATTTRAWEFAAGGVLALLPAPGGRAWIRAAVSWLGLAAILTAALTLDAATPFPGVAALLPVAGALAVIAAGSPVARAGPSRLLALTPVQRVGDLSYGIYLWHWPLLVLAPYALGHAVGTPEAIGIAGCAFVAAMASKHLVEDPIRHRRPHTRAATGLTLAVAGCATAAFAGATLLGGAYVDARVAHDHQATARLLAAHPRCFGAAAHDPRRPCRNPALARTVAPSPLEAQQQRNAPCTMVLRRSRLRVCAFGAPAGRAGATIALLGDSHASSWRAALEPVARARGWRGLSVTRTGCPYIAGTLRLVEPERTDCRTWHHQVRLWFARHPEVGTVFVAAHAGVALAGDDSAARVRDAYARAWAALPGSVRHIVVLRDTPLMRATTLTCVAREAGADAGQACAVPRARALRPDPQVAAAALVPGARTVDVTAAFCGPRVCLPVIGGALAYRDQDHLTPTFARTLGPWLGRALTTLDA